MNKKLKKSFVLILSITLLSINIQTVAVSALDNLKSEEAQSTEKVNQSTDVKVNAVGTTELYEGDEIEFSKELGDKLKEIAGTDNITQDTFINYRNLDLSNSNITDLTGLDKLDLSYVRLDLTGNKIGSVDAENNNFNIINEMLKLSTLRSLDLSNTNMNDQDIDKLDEISVESLNLSRNTQINDLFKLAEKISWVSSLDLSYNNLKDLNSLIDDTDNEFSINSLNLSGNEIEDLSKLTINKFPSLYKLDLSKNKLKDSTFETLGANETGDYTIRNQLSQLTLSDNTINDLSIFNLDSDEPKNTFESLYILSLRNNGLKSEHVDTLDNENIQQLDLSKNDITGINIHGKFLYLQKLNLAENNITTLANIKGIGASDDNNYYYLELILSHNSISKIDFSEDLYKIRSLYLDHNEISDLTPLKDLLIDENDYGENYYLYNLVLSYNNIENLKGIPFEKLRDLRSLDLDNNKISDISPIKTLLDEYYYRTNIKLRNQYIELDKIEQSGTFSIENPIKYWKGNFDFIRDEDISDNGTYKDNKITWNNIKNKDYVGFKFSQMFFTSGESMPSKLAKSYLENEYFEYSGYVRQPINKTTTGGGGSGGSGGGGETTNPPAATAILANGEKYTDVLTATVLGNERSCPILLTGKDTISKETLDELYRRGIGDIIISGGPDSVSQKVVDQLKEFNVIRIAGEDRYETAEEIGNEVRRLTGNLNDAMLVDGTNFPDVITISALATQKRAPILITEPELLTKTTDNTIKDWKVDDITIGGSYNSVSKNVEDNLDASTIKRIGGLDRYETAALIGEEVRKITENKSDLILVDGTDFPDGITINSLAARYKSPILLTNPNSLTKVTADKIKDWSISNILIGGGENSVSKNVETSLGVNKIERVAGKDRYETAVKISQRLSEAKALGEK